MDIFKDLKKSLLMTVEKKGNKDGSKAVNSDLSLKDILKQMKNVRQKRDTSSSEVMSTSKN